MSSSINMDQLTLSLEEAHASPSPSQRASTETAWMENLVSCTSISALYEKFARNGFCGRTCPEFSKLKTMRSGSCSNHYLNAGMVLHGECLMLDSSEWHNDAGVSFLWDALEAEEVPRRFYLTATACAGILRRARERERDLPPMLANALEYVAGK